MKPKHIPVTVFLALLITTSQVTAAQTYTSEEQELRAQLFAIIADLQQQIATLIALRTTTSYTFTDTDKAARGSEGEHVRQLQKALNKLGYTIASTGDGSPGKETIYFGPATENALKRFQAAQGIVSSGNPESTGYGALGPSTRAKLNSLLVAPSSTSKPNDVVTAPNTSTTPYISDDKTVNSGTSGGGGGSSYEDSSQEPTVNLIVNDSSIIEGDSVTLTWSSKNADSCIGTNFSTNNDTYGSVLLSPASTITYSISCTGGGEVDGDSVSVVVSSGAVSTCSSFTYSSWGSCQSNNTQNRTVLTSSPDGCVGGNPITTQSCVYNPPQSSSNDPYDLSVYNIPFEYEWPIQPVITVDVTVTPDTLEENNIDGRRLTLSAGDYGDVHSESDQEWILQDGANIDIFDYSGSRRLIVRGETPRVGRIGMITGPSDGTTSDVLFNGVYQSSGLWSGDFETSNGPGGNRIAIVNSSLNCASYCIFNASTITDGITDFILAGNYIRSDDISTNDSMSTPQHLVRLMSLNTFVIVDNYMVKTTNGMVFRIHTNAPAENPGQDLDSYDGYVGDNVMIASYTEDSYMAINLFPASSSYVPATIRNIVFEDNEVYNPLGSIIAIAGSYNDPVRPVDLTFVNNRGYGGGGWPETTNNPSFIVSGNTAEAFGSVAPPTSFNKLGF